MLAGAMGMLPDDVHRFSARRVAGKAGIVCSFHFLTIEVATTLMRSSSCSPVRAVRHPTAGRGVAQAWGPYQRGGRLHFPDAGVGHRGGSAPVSTSIVESRRRTRRGSC